MTRAAALMLLATSLSACSPGYVLRAAWEEARILSKSRPIDEVLSDPQLASETRGKLELVVAARSFAARELRLDVGDSYTSYADIGRDTLALVLSASPMDRLTAHTWWFPIVGRVPYKGFFSREAAEAARLELERQRLDTYLRPTSAFSTLGWLPDPLLSTALREDSVALVETVIHEVTHNTLFISGEVKFNESLANFVGSVGAIEFFCGRADAGPACELARSRWHDTLQMSEFLDRLWTDLESLYAEGLPLDSLAPRRAALLALAAARFTTEYAPTLRTPDFERFDATRLNNASLIARHLYYHRLPIFQRLYECTGGLADALQLLIATLRDADDPWAAVEELLRSLEAASIDLERAPHSLPATRAD